MTGGGKGYGDQCMLHLRIAKRLILFQIYRNFNFQRDKPGLFKYIWGKEDLGNLAKQATCVPIPLSPSQGPISKKKKMSPTRYSPRFYCKPEEDGVESGKKNSNNQAHKGNHSFVFSSVWAMKAIPGYYLQNQPSGEPSNTTVEDTSHNIRMPPTAPGVQGTEVPSASSPGHRILHSMMSLYNDCCSAIFSALSQRPMNESPIEEEQEGSSDYKRVICEPIKNNPHL